MITRRDSGKPNSLLTSLERRCLAYHSGHVGEKGRKQKCAEDLGHCFYGFPQERQDRAVNWLGLAGKNNFGRLDIVAQMYNPCYFEVEMWRISV
jgi:hypothetical protein